MFRIMSKVVLASWIVFGAMAANAGFLKYDVTYTGLGGSPVPDFQGYMLFDDAGFVAGDIWDRVVDWQFDVAGFIYTPANTVAAADGYFSVDAAGNFVSDLTFGAGLGVTPCFLDVGTGCSSAPLASVLLGFTSTFRGATINNPVTGAQTALFEGDVTYSAPESIPVLGTLPLLLTALWGLARTRARRSNGASGLRRG